MFTSTSTYDIPMSSTQTNDESFKQVATKLAKLFSANEFTDCQITAHRALLKFLHSLEGQFSYPEFIKEAKKKYAQNSIVQLSISLKQLFKLAGLELDTKGVKVKSVITEAVHVTELELSNIYKCEYLHDVWKLVSEVFLIMAWTGSRFSDYQKVSLKDGAIIQQKRGAIVYLPMHPVVVRILKKYGGVAPKISYAVFNKHIGSVCRAAGLGDKSDKIKSHSGRRSFCSNLYERKVSDITIMAVSGHKNHLDFVKYVRSTQQKHSEIINDVWNNKK